MRQSIGLIELSNSHFVLMGAMCKAQKAIDVQLYEIS